MTSCKKSSYCLHVGNKFCYRCVDFSLYLSKNDKETKKRIRKAKKVIYKAHNPKQFEEEIAARLSSPCVLKPIDYDKQKMEDKIKELVIYTTQGENYFSLSEDTLVSHLKTEQVLFFRFNNDPMEYGIWDFDMFLWHIERANPDTEAQTTIGSGNKWIQPGDVMYEDYLIEAKERKGFTIERGWLVKVAQEAKSINKHFVLVTRIKNKPYIFTVQTKADILNLIQAKM